MCVGGSRKKDGIHPSFHVFYTNFNLAGVTRDWLLSVNERQDASIKQGKPQPYFSLIKHLEAIKQPWKLRFSFIFFNSFYVRTVSHKYQLVCNSLSPSKVASFKVKYSDRKHFLELKTNFLTMLKSRIIQICAFFKPLNHSLT